MSDDGFPIPESLISNTLRRGEAETLWLDRLPIIAGDLAQRWRLTLEPPFENLSYNYVTPVRLASGEPAVLKLCYPGEELHLEAAALRAFDGGASVRLLDAGLDQGALLLERLLPGTVVSRLNDDVAETSAAAAVMRGLWRPPPAGHAFPNAMDWVNDALSPDAIPETKRTYPWLERALQRVAQIATEPTEQYLLHGDLHHDNILASRRGWLAIDPKGLIGDPAWELAPFLFNNLHKFNDNDWPRAVRRRADQLADELALNRDRVYAWSAVRAIQSAFWSLRDDAATGSFLWRAAVTCAQELTRAP